MVCLTNETSSYQCPNESIGGKKIAASAPPPVKEVVLKIAAKRDGIGTVLTFSPDQASPDNIPLQRGTLGDVRGMRVPL
jgi:hypothetical protein